MPTLTWRSASSARACSRPESLRLDLGGGRQEEWTVLYTTFTAFFVLGVGVIREVDVRVMVEAVEVMVPVVH